MSLGPKVKPGEYILEGYWYWRVRKITGEAMYIRGLPHTIREADHYDYWPAPDFVPPKIPTEYTHEIGDEFLVRVRVESRGEGYSKKGAYHIKPIGIPVLESYVFGETLDKLQKVEK